MDEQRDLGKQTEAWRCGASDGALRPLALGLGSHLGARLAERDLRLP